MRPPPAFDTLEPLRLPGPVLAVCGWSGSGKTTLLESTLPELVRKGLAVAVLKHDAHGLEVDRPGKDSDRLFRAGADVVLSGPSEVLRRHRRTPQDEPGIVLAGMLADHDLVLVEGHKDTRLPKVWLQSENGPPPPVELTETLAVLPWGGDRPGRFLEVLEAWLESAWRRVPVRGGVLIGGVGSRLGHSNQARPRTAGTLLDAVVAAITPAVAEVVLLGNGPVPASQDRLPRLGDSPGYAGPLAGMLAAMRWAPGHAWLFAACDLPELEPAAARWLVDQRSPGRWAVLPDCGRGVEPLLALYEPQARGPLEALAASGVPAPRRLAEDRKTVVLIPPPELRRCWRNADSPEDSTEVPAGPPSRP